MDVMLDGMVELSFATDCSASLFLMYSLMVCGVVESGADVMVDLDVEVDVDAEKVLDRSDVETEVVVSRAAAEVRVMSPKVTREVRRVGRCILRYLEVGLEAVKVLEDWSAELMK